MAGFIKLYRKMTEWEWYQDSNVLRVFLHLLLHANHKPKRWKGVDIQAGQRVTSRQNLADELQLSVQQVRLSLTKLKSTNEITIKTTNRFTLITIVNWDSYQSSDEFATNKTTNKRTNKQPTNNQQTTTNKNEKNENNLYMSDFDDSLRENQMGDDEDIVSADGEILPEKKSNKEVENFFEEMWKLYPRKLGKSRVSIKTKKEIYKLGDKFKCAIETYSKQCKEKNVKEEFIKHGSTFFNMDYQDYLPQGEQQKKQEIKFIEVDADDYRDNFEKYYKP